MRLLQRAHAFQLRNIAGLLLSHLCELVRVFLSDRGELAALLLHNFLKLSTDGFQAAVCLIGPGKLLFQKIVIAFQTLNDFLVSLQLANYRAQVFKLDHIHSQALLLVLADLLQLLLEFLARLDLVQL